MIFNAQVFFFYRRLILKNPLENGLEVRVENAVQKSDNPKRVPLVARVVPKGTNRAKSNLFPWDWLWETVAS